MSAEERAHQAGVGDVPEELAGGAAASGLGPEGSGDLAAEAALGDQGGGATVDDRRDVAGLTGLDVPVLRIRTSENPAAASSPGSRRTSQGSCTLEPTQASTHACNGSAGLRATLVVA